MKTGDAPRSAIKDIQCGWNQNVSVCIATSLGLLDVLKGKTGLTLAVFPYLPKVFFKLNLHENN